MAATPVAPVVVSIDATAGDRCGGDAGGRTDFAVTDTELDFDLAFGGDAAFGFPPEALAWAGALAWPGACVRAGDSAGAGAALTAADREADDDDDKNENVC